jgi:alpha-L-fucosidase 2
VRARVIALFTAAATTLGLASATAATATSDPPTSAWSHGRFVVDVPSVVGRSDVVLGQPNRAAGQALPLGNGSLGVGLWSADGLTAQLNRADTLPDRLSPGQLVIPGLSQLTSAPDYSGRLDLYDGRFVESGGGMTATAYVDAHTDALVVDVAGADPATTQTARLRLWAPREPTATVRGATGALSQTWRDVDRPGASGRTFGAMAAITASGRAAQADVADPRTVQVNFRPHRDGSFRVVVASPRWPGRPGAHDALGAAGPIFAAAARGEARHLRWWHDYWRHVGLMKLSSADGAAQYLENIRTVALFAAAAERGTVRPGSQAGVADLFDSAQDAHSWDPASYWGWNLRMLVTANLGAGAFENNDAYFAMYRDDLSTITAWTASQFGGLPGACTPETMRFNGVGQQVHQDSDGNWGARPYLDCSAQGPANYNARTLSTGGEVALFIWQTYLATDDRRFLARNYPVMAQWARFMLAYAKVGADGYLHTDPSNAHETQWDVHDPTTDIAAMRAVFPAVAAAARTLHRDRDLAARLDTAEEQILPYPLTDTGVIGFSYDQTAKARNVENLGLEPVWPWGLIGDQGPGSALAQRTFTERPFVERNDWSFDPIDAARLGRAADMRRTALELTEQYQKRISGLASFGSSYPEQYAEQGGVITTALQDSLVQDYDGLLRIAPAWPGEWDADATVYIQHRDKVDVQVREGTPTTVALEAGSNAPVLLRNPWPGQRFRVVSGDGRRTVVPSTDDDVVTVPARAGHAYLVERVGAPRPRFAPVTGTPATAARHLGPVQIGLDRP